MPDKNTITINIKKVNIYLMTTINTIKAADGKIAYILEYKGDNREPVTLTTVQEINQCTSNKANVEVLVQALERLTEPCLLDIYTDSGYLVSVLNGWLKQWESNNWVTAHNKPVANKELMQRLAILLNSHKYTIHSNIKHEYYDWLSCELKK